MHIYIQSGSTGEEAAAGWSPDFTLNIRATVKTDQKGAIERFRNLKTADENKKGKTDFVIATERRQRCRAGREMAPASPV